MAPLPSDRSIPPRLTVLWWFPALPLLSSSDHAVIPATAMVTGTEAASALIAMATTSVMGAITGVTITPTIIMVAMETGMTAVKETLIKLANTLPRSSWDFISDS